VYVLLTLPVIVWEALMVAGPEPSNPTSVHLIVMVPPVEPAVTRPPRSICGGGSPGLDTPETTLIVKPPSVPPQLTCPADVETKVVVHTPTHDGTPVESIVTLFLGTALSDNVSAGGVTA